MKRCFGLLILISIALISMRANGQSITVGSVEAGPYGIGSTISIPVQIGSSTVYNKTQRFELYLSDINGNFSPGILIGQLNGFYTSFLNGIIPAGTLAGANYRLKVVSTNPTLSSNPSNTFEIKAINGTSVILSAPNNVLKNDLIYGFCTGVDITRGLGDNRKLNIFNNSATGSSLSANLTNEVNHTVRAIDFIEGVAQINLNIAYYTLSAKSIDINGIISTRSYQLVNSTNNISIGTSGALRSCLPDNLSVKINTNPSDPQSILTNFPGITYTLSWGDGQTQEYTLAEIIQKDGYLTHLYNQTSCGIGSGSNVNQFPINIRLKSPYVNSTSSCDEPNVTAYAKILYKPTAKFSFAAYACVNKPVLFTNTSASSAVGDECADPLQSTWYVNEIPVNTNGNANLTYTFLTPGTYKIALEVSNGTCDPNTSTKTICIEPSAVADFTLNSNNICLPNAVNIVNTTTPGAICRDYTYAWQVRNAANTTVISGVLFTPSATDKNPKISISTPGNYMIRLIVSNSCGTITKDHPISIAGNPTVSFPVAGEINYCQFGPKIIDFGTDINHKPTFNAVNSKSIAYIWDISGGTYSFVSGNANSANPIISFDDFSTYIVKLTYGNECSSKTITQTIKLNQYIKVNAGDDQTLCDNSPIQLTATIKGPAPTKISWIGGTGTFSPGRDVLNPTYTPSPSEIGTSLKLTIQANTSNPLPCDIVTDDLILNIAKKNSITSLSSISICSQTQLNYQPIATINGSTFIWTSIGSGSIEGNTASGSGDIHDILVNTNPANPAFLTYIITPINNLCPGTPFTLKVTVSPRPAISAQVANQVICSDQPAGISWPFINTTSIPAANIKFKWTSIADAGITGNTQQTIASTVNAIPDILKNTGSGNASVTYIITPVSASGCEGEPSSISLTVQGSILPGNLKAQAGADDNICNESEYALQANDAGTFSGTWSLISGQTGINITSPNQSKTLVKGLQAGQSYIFRWTITQNNSCASSYDEMILINNAPISNNVISLSTTGLCSGQSAIITGTSPTSANNLSSLGQSSTDGTNFVWQSSTDGTNWVDINGKITKDLTIQVTSNIFIRRTVYAGTCNSNSNILEVIVQKPITSNTILKDQTICYGMLPTILTGSTPNGGDENFKYQWERNNGDGNWAAILGSKDINYQPDALFTSTRFRRIVSSTICSGPQQNTSNEILITVNPEVKVSYKFTNDKGCAPFVLNSQNIQAQVDPNLNAQYSWFANDIQIGTGVNFPGYTISDKAQSVVIKLVVSSQSGCGSSEFKHTFQSAAGTIASFSQDITQGCGPLTLKFTNNSSSLTDGSFNWDFGNGQTSNSIQPVPVTFAANPSGKDTTYHVILKYINICGITTYTSDVLVKYKIKAIISPDRTNGCSPLTVNFSNTSIGENTTYTIDFGDGQTYTTTNKQKISHIFNTSLLKTYTVKLTATNNCATDYQEFKIKVAPSTVDPKLVVNGDEKSGCAPFTVRFFNNSTGASLFEYDFGDGNSTRTNSSPETVVHTFNKSGTFLVKLKASNGCSDTLATETITVFEQPKALFGSTVTKGCAPLPIQFQSHSTSAIQYFWDFGDGLTSTDTNPIHTYGKNKPSYTVKLIATNKAGCTDTLIMEDYIQLAIPPVAKFDVGPSPEIRAPNFKFNFADRSTNDQVLCKWNFGDGGTSKKQNPDYTYADTGTFKVTLTIYNSQGCSDSTYRFIHISGTPGNLYIPNAFMPESQTPELKIFKLKGKGLLSYHIRIFNKFGQVFFESTILNEDGEPYEFWDGTYHGEPVSQGVYIWEATAKYINGLEWEGMKYDGAGLKRTGFIHLIR